MIQILFAFIFFIIALPALQEL